jgi:hypothetical protein
MNQTRLPTRHPTSSRWIDCPRLPKTAQPTLFLARYQA